MIPLSTKPLLQFYKDWLAAAEAPDADSDNHHIFFNTMGLCGNLEMWLEEHYGYDDPVFQAAFRRMEWQFQSAGLDNTYPFGEAEYSRGAYHDAQHKDKKRLAWVKARIADMEDAK